MKLTKHQKEIVKKIIAEEVYDIQSYLKVFKKGSSKKYDIQFLKHKFQESEKNIKYKVMKKGNSIYNQVSTPANYTIAGVQLPSITIPMPRSQESISENEWEETSAVLDDNIPHKKFKYDNNNFSFDFKKNGVYIANSFEDIKDFIALWYYLKRESLILEVDKTIEESDISIFYELNNIVSNEDNTVQRDNSRSDYIPINPFQTNHDILDTPPMRQILTYLEEDWILNEEHILMCKEYIGKKILPISELKIYIANKFKTLSEISQYHSMVVAWIAVVLSVIAILIGNILPMFQPSDIKYLSDIDNQLTEISRKLVDLENINISDYDDIKNYLNDIITSLNTTSPVNNEEQINKLIFQIEEIKDILLNISSSE